MTTTTDTRPRWLVLTALVMVAINLRMALSSIPAVVTDIEDVTGWSGVTIGTLTTIPVLCMGGFALLVPRIARRIGRRHAVALALALLTIALVSRLFATVPGVLHMSVFLAGIGIAIAGGLVPSIVREQVPDAVGAATGLWTATMLFGAALGGALTVPLAAWLGSWQRALAFWAIPAAIGLVVWWLVETRHRHAAQADRPLVAVRELPWRDRTAWALTAYLALNSVVFYTALAWLAPSFVERGWTRAEAGWLLGVFTVSEVGFALVMPLLAERSRAPRTIYAATIVFVVLPILMVAWLPSTLTWLALFVFGAALGGSFAMGLALLSEYAATPASSARLTAMAFSVTYVTAALGPLVAGAILDAIDSWPVIYTLLALAAAAQLATVPALRRGIRIE
jgi:CP family cyanate transporter-like MFS transporter